MDKKKCHWLNKFLQALHFEESGSLFQGIFQITTNKQNITTTENSDAKRQINYPLQ